MKRYRRTLLLLGLLLAGVTSCYVFWPLLGSREVPLREDRPLLGTSTSPLWERPAAVQIRLRGMLAFYVLWFFALGACFGSFVNVVAFRWPRGRTILGSSHCPYCHVKIQLRDNIPLVSWLALGGRCRTCRLPIAARYWLAEFVAGALFAIVLCVEVLTGGANLPTNALGSDRDLAWLLLEPPWALLGVYAYHMTLLTVLWTATLVQLDGLRVPKRLLLFAVAVGLGLAAVWPTLHPIAWANPRPRWAQTLSLGARLDTGLIGLAAGSVIGALLGLLVRLPRTRLIGLSRPALIAPLATVGLFLGWQAVVGVSVVMATLLLIAMAISAAWPCVARLPGVAYLMLSVLGYLCGWRTIATTDWGPSATAPPAVLLAWTLVAVLGAAAAWRVLEKRREATR